MTEPEPAPADPSPPPEQPPPEAPHRQPAAGAAPDDGPAPPPHLQQTLYQVFLGEATGTFGIDNGPHRRLRAATGTMTADEVSAARRHYLRTAEWHQAAATLDHHRLAVLVGDEGTGRLAAAVNLLAPEGLARDETIVRISPATRLSELAQHHFERGGRYLVQDRLPEIGPVATQRFELDNTLDALKKAGARLVVTARPSPSVRTVMARQVIPWHGPDPIDLLHQQLAARAVGQPEKALERLRTRARQLRLPGAVVNLVERLSIDGLDGALTSVDETTVETVQAWFDQGPPWDEVLLVATLAFTDGLPTRHVEGHAADLRRRSHRVDKDLGLRTDPASSDPSNADDKPGRGMWAQTRLQWPSLITQLTATPFGAADDSPPQRILMFSAGLVGRVAVLDALVDRYGVDLWRPLEDWLDATAAHPALTVNVAVARGVSLLAHRPENLAHVVEVLQRWAVRGFREQLTTSLVISWLADDNQHHPTALRICVDWITSNDGRAVAAGLAFAGPLALRYPFEARRSLWYLATRDGPAARAARWSLQFLVAVGATYPENAEALLRHVNRQIDHFSEHASRPGRFAAMLATAEDIVAAAGLDGGGPAVAHLLVNRPASIGDLGGIWAALLRNAAHRGRAINTLLELLRALSPDDVAAVGRLAQAVAARLPPMERDMLVRDETWKRDHTSAARRPNEAVFDAFIQGLANPPSEIKGTDSSTNGKHRED